VNVRILDIQVLTRKGIKTEEGKKKEKKERQETLVA